MVPLSLGVMWQLKYLLGWFDCALVFRDCRNLTTDKLFQGVNTEIQTARTRVKSSWKNTFSSYTLFLSLVFSNWAFCIFFLLAWCFPHILVFQYLPFQIRGKCYQELPSRTKSDPPSDFLSQLWPCLPGTYFDLVGNAILDAQWKRANLNGSGVIVLMFASQGLKADNPSRIFNQYFNQCLTFCDFFFCIKLLLLVLEKKSVKGWCEPNIRWVTNYPSRS